MKEDAPAPPLRPLRRLTRAFALLRGDEAFLILLGVAAGACAGVFAVAILRAALFLHESLYGATRLSAMESLDSAWRALIPAAGGLVVGLSVLLARRWRPGRPVDPIEANALRGGRMSLVDSVAIVAQTAVSNGFGASVGLEAAYTQMGSGFASFLGARLGMRREDLRMLVGCGAAGAIAAAFSAPLTGAFYAFELVLGVYTPFALAPIGGAALAGALAAHFLGAVPELVRIPDPAQTLSLADTGLMLALAAFCALFGIAVMRVVTLVEAGFQGSGLPSFLHPFVGGLAVGALALASPHVLSSGHEATYALFEETSPALGLLAFAILAKALAAAISIGSGFRGGLFFASLYLGALTGWLAAQLSVSVLPGAPLDGWTCALIGMAAMAVAIVGGPLTMGFLALEMTRNLSLTLVILAAVTLAAIIVRRVFGYSFATWRLHLRGESIRGAQDVGLIREVTVSRLMRPDPTRVPFEAQAETALAAAGAAQWLIAVDADDAYKGLVFLPDLRLLAAGRLGARTAEAMRATDDFLAPQTSAEEAMAAFARSGSPALAVVDDAGRPVGLLTEAALLRSYAKAVDSARRALAGEPRRARRPED